MEVNKISDKRFLEVKEVIAYLEALVAGFRSGKIVVEQAEQFVSLHPPELVEVEVAAKIKKNKSKFSLELAWRGNPEGQEKPLIITDREPEAPAAPPEAATGAPAEPAAPAAPPECGKQEAASEKKEAAKSSAKAAKKPAAKSGTKK